MRDCSLQIATLQFRGIERIEVVKAGHAMASGQQTLAEMTANEASGAGNQKALRGRVHCGAYDMRGNRSAKA